MSASRLIQDVRVHGSVFKTTLAAQIVEGEMALSVSQVAAFDFTVLDRHDLPLTTEAGKVFKDGTVITWNGYALALTAFRTGGGAKAPTVTVEATSDFVDSLKQQTGGKSWGKTPVSPWANTIIRSAGAVPYVQPSLGDREIERAEAEGDLADAENSWDVLAEMAKQTGSWLFEYGNRIVLAKPSWLVAQTGTQRYSVVWNSWTDHTAALTSAPAYAWDKDKKPWEGRETLTIEAVDPGEGSTNPLSKARPGDILLLEGRGNPTDDPTWLITEVTHPAVAGRPTAINCRRPIDPPEVVPEDQSDKGSGSTAGVPNGPIGSLGWQGEQLKNATEIVKEGQRRSLPDLALELAVACSMGESSLRNIGYGDVAGPDSTGLFQQRDTWGSRSDRMSPGKSAGLFYAALTATNYKATYDNGGASVVFGGNYGPPKTSGSASLAIHNVQRNSDPTHYTRFWADALLVVKACIEAGTTSGGGGGGGGSPKINSLMASYEGKYIDVDGAYQNQCVDLAAKFITDLTGIPMIQGNGKDYYNHPSLRSRFTAIPGFNNPQKGDIVAWSGVSGAFQNGGFGHVAIYSHTAGGTHMFLSQNPGNSRTMPLSAFGVLGVMRLKS